MQLKCGQITPPDSSMAGETDFLLFYFQQRPETELKYLVFTSDTILHTFYHLNEQSVKTIFCDGNEVQFQLENCKLLEGRKLLYRQVSSFSYNHFSDTFHLKNRGSLCQQTFL